MTPREFTYWLQGFCELHTSNKWTSEQVALIKKHLALVFTNVTGPLQPEAQADESDFDFKKLQEALKKEICSTGDYSPAGVRLC